MLGFAGDKMEVGVSNNIAVPCVKAEPETEEKPPLSSPSAARPPGEAPIKKEYALNAPSF